MNFPLRGTVLAAAMAASALLSACAPLIIGGAAVGGAMVATDRRTSGTQVDDESIELKSLNRVKEVLGDRGHVNVTSYGRQVLLTGEVPTDADKASLEQSVASIPNVRGTINELAVMGPSSIGGRSNDTLITTKVKAALVDAKDVFSNSIKVVTERGTVYLMGRVTEREAKRATDIARSQNGVAKVVRVFDVISEGELAETVPKAPVNKE